MTNIGALLYNYHNLDGTLVKDKKKSLKKFINNVQSKTTSEGELNELISAIDPKNDQEESFMVEVLVHFKRYGQLMSILKQSENPVLIGKILKCWKFFEDTFKNISPDELVNDLFPNTSCSTRMKIINRLYKNLKDEKCADDYFKAIEEKYGLRVATVLLPACSMDLIVNRVATYDIKLTSRQLMYIVKKQTDFLDFYFNLVYKTDNNFNFSTKYVQVIKYVAKYDVELFWSLSDRYKLHVKFGKSMTTLLLENKKELVRHHEKCTDFTKKQIYKVITKNDEDFKQFFLSFYPAKMEEFKTNCLHQNSALTSFLNYVSKPNRYVVMNDHFKTMYGKNLHDDLECVTEYSLSIMPRNIRDVVLEKKIIEVEELIYMFDTKKSIPAIKERIKHTTDMDSRKKYVSLLYQTCQFNKDESALLDVLKYLFHRLKNENFTLNCFMRRLNKWPDLEKLSDEHWKVINVFLKISEVPNYNRYYEIKKTEYLEKYFVHLCESNQSTEEYMTEICKYVLEDQLCRYVFIFDAHEKYQKHQKLFLERLGVLIQETVKGSELMLLSRRFLMIVACYNERYPSGEIPILNYKDMLTFSKSGMKDHINAQITIQHCVRKELDGYDLMFWKNYNILYHDSMVMWYAKTRPHRLIENFHLVLANGFPEVQIDALVFALDARLPTSIIQNEFVKFINESIRKENFEKAVSAVRGLSHLAKCGDFLKSVESLYPHPDGKYDENVKKVKLQKCVVKSLPNLKNPSGTLTTLLKFCKRDYLKYALPNLYAITNKTREINLPGFFEELFASTISVRKHAVILTTLLLPQQAIYFILKEQVSKEKHPSVKKVIFKATLSYFIQNPSEIFWNLVLNNMDILGDKDRRAHNVLLDKMGKIPMAYLPQYITTIYEKFSKNPYKDIEAKKYALLAIIPYEVVQDLNVDFLELVIKETFLNTPINTDHWNFCFKWIFNKSGKIQILLLEFVLKYFMTYVEKNWCIFVDGEIRRNVYSFVSTICVNALRFKSDNKLIKEFIARWSLVFKPQEVFDEYLLLLLTSAYLECDSENSTMEFGKKANEILASLVNQYDSSVTAIYSELLQTFLGDFVNITKTTKTLHLFMESFTSANPTRQTFMVTCDLLRTCRFNDESIYDKIVERVQKCKDPVVQVHYKYLLKSCT